MVERFSGISRREILALIGPAFFKDPGSALKSVVDAYARTEREVPPAWDDELQKAFGYVDDELKESLMKEAQANQRNRRGFFKGQAFKTLSKKLWGKIQGLDTEAKVGILLGVVAMIMPPDWADDIMQSREAVTTIVKSFIPRA